MKSPDNYMNKITRILLTPLVSLSLAFMPVAVSNTLAAPDTVAPSVVTNLTAALNAGNQVVLFWTPATDNVGVSGYTVMRNNVVLANTTNPVYVDTSALASTTYSYAVTAFDAAGNVSAPSNSVSITTLATASGDTIAPSAPSNLSVTLNSSNQALLSWTAATDNVGVVGYAIMRNNQHIANTATTSIIDATVASSTTYAYAVLAYDAAGNVSPASNSVSITTGTATADTSAPSVPSNLTATAVSSSGINLAWTASTDNVAVISYNIYRNSTLVGTSVTNSFSDTGLSPATTYSYTVSALDAAGNMSAQSVAASSTTMAASGDTTPPSAPNNLSASLNSSNQVVLSWTAATDNVAVTGYKVMRNNTLLATVTGTSYTDTTALASTTYSYTVTAFDAAGNNSTISNTVPVTTGTSSNPGNKGDDNGTEVETEDAGNNANNGQTNEDKQATTSNSESSSSQAQNNESALSPTSQTSSDNSAPITSSTSTHSSNDSSHNHNGHDGHGD